MPVLPGDQLPSTFVAPPRPPPAPTYQDVMASIGHGFYYHPSMGVGVMTGGWNDPRDGGKRLHQGQDIKMSEGTPLVAVTSGTIQWYKNSSAGTVIYLKGDDGNKYSYFHLSDRLVRHGARVSAGQTIALSGNTGNSSAPHLHFETWIGGQKVDPRLFLSHTRSPGGPGQLPPDTSTIDFFGDEEFRAQLEAILAEIDLTPPRQDESQEAWIQQLKEFQQQLADMGLAESPRKRKARDILHSTLRGLSGMVKRDGYGDPFPSVVSSAEDNRVRLGEAEENRVRLEGVSEE